MMFQGSDLIAHITICHDCATELRNEMDRKEKETSAKAKWETSVPAEYRATDITHQDYPLDLHKYALGWRKKPSSRLWLGIIGKSGIGKSRVASQLAKRVIWEGGFVLWVGSYQFQHAAQNQFSDIEGKECGKSLERMRKAPFLVFDDIGSLKGTEVISETLYALLEHRSACSLPMVWTSNEMPEEMLIGRIGEKPRSRNISRLTGYSDIVEL